MPTIKDIAREAGVSHGTVSNVINGKGNVSVEKINLVWHAAKKLGYKVNAKAQSLRQQINRTIAIFLPGIEYKRCAVMYEVFQREFVQNGYSVQLYSTYSMETTETDLLSEALNARVSAVITSSCLVNAVARYREQTSDLPLVFLQWSGPTIKDTMYAGFDLEKAGRETAAFVKEHNAKYIGLFINSSDLPDSALFLQGFRSIYAYCDDKIRILDCPNHQVDLRAFEFFDTDISYDYIICADQMRETAVRNASIYASQKFMPKFVTLMPRSALTEPDLPVYELDYKLLAHKIVKQLIARLEKDVSLPSCLHIENNGFREIPTPNLQVKVKTLQMLTIASPSTTALSRLIPYLKKSTGIHLEMTILPALRDVYNILQTDAWTRYDLVRMDVAWLDELAKQVFCPLNQIAFDWDKLLSLTIPELGRGYTDVRGIPYCVPYDPSTQLLFYRRDLFNNPTYKRMYYEKYRQELTIPDTFSDYNRIASFFTRTYNPTSPIQYGSTLAIGNAAVSPSEFMPRLFSEGGTLLDDQGKITLNTSESLKALQNYRETYKYSDRIIYDFWKNVLEGFADGSAAMTVVFINYASHIMNLKISSIAGKLGFAPVPGKKPLLGGGVIGITQTCKCAEVACAFLNWLYSDLIAPVFTMLGGLSPCKSAYGNRDINEKYPWLSTARRSFPNAQRRKDSSYYNNFSELQLENILAVSIQEAVLDICTPEEALKQAQLTCDGYFRPKHS